MAGPIPKASLLDNLRFNLCHVVPYFLGGVFTPNRRWVGWLSWLRWHPFSPRFVQHLRRKYRSDCVYVNMAGRPSLAVLNVAGVRQVLDRSPTIYAESQLKRKGMSHWQPQALTISRGDAWRLRRAFNESVLASGERIHPDADYFLEVVRTATAAVCPERWDDFARLFDSIMMQVIFGKSADASRLSRTLTQLRREANRVAFLNKSRLLDGFVAEIRQHLAASGPHGLITRCRDVQLPSMTRAEYQLPHWMFAIKETLAANVVQALALIVTHPEDELHVRDEMKAVELSRPGGIDSLHYLEGCVQEAMRLWPTTPLLVREMVRRDTLGGAIVPAGTQVLVFNNFHHRDTTADADADSFRPGRWEDSAANYRFNHLSNGRQVCAGKHLALFLAKATLATLLDGSEYHLIRPRLKPDRPLPSMFNYFNVRFSRTARG